MILSSRANPFVFVTGGCRSGKSAYAQRIAEALSPRGLYLATAQIRDEEMRQRARRHQEARGPRWRLHELPPGAAPEAWQGLSLLVRPDEALLFDCLTLWAAGRMIEESAPEKVEFMWDDYHREQIAEVEAEADDDWDDDWDEDDDEGVEIVYQK